MFMVGTCMHIHTYMHAFTHIMYAVSAKLDIRPYKSTDCIRQVCFSPNFPPPKGQRGIKLKPVNTTNYSLAQTMQLMHTIF